MSTNMNGTGRGVTPELGEKTINMKCHNPKCSSITAVELKIPKGGNSNRLYQCTRCHFTWSVSVGGNFSF